MGLQEALESMRSATSVEDAKDKFIDIMIGQLDATGKPWYYRFIPEQWRPMWATFERIVVLLVGGLSGAWFTETVTPPKVETQVVSAPSDPALKTLKEMIAEAKAAAEKAEKAATTRQRYTLKTRDGTIIDQGEF